MPPPESPNVWINELETHLTVTEGLGPLSAEEVKRIVAMVLAQIGTEQDRMARLAKTTTIRDRAYQPRIGD